MKQLSLMFKGPTYGAAEMGVNCVEVFIRLHLLVFYIDVVGLRPAVAGLALGVGIFWDAMADPIIGVLSDRSFQKRGRRTGWLLAGIILVIATLLALLDPPPLHSEIAKFFYLLVGSLIFNTSYTCLTVPYSAMVGDITAGERERARLVGWRMGFGNIGAFAGVALPSYFLIHKLSSPYPKATLAIAAVVLIAGFTTWTSVSLLPHKSHATTSKPLPWHLALLKPLRNASFRPLLAAYCMANIGLTMNTSLALYYYRLHLQFSEKNIQTLLLLFLLVFTGTIPLWILASKRIPKDFLMMIAVCALGLIVAFVYPLLKPHDFGTALFWAAGVIGAMMGGSVLLESFFTDVVKKQEAAEGEDLMGLYFGVWKMTNKISRGITLAMTGLVLAWAHVTPLSQPSDNSYERLAIAFGPFVAVFFLSSSMILLMNLRQHRKAPATNISALQEMKFN